MLCYNTLDIYSCCRWERPFPKPKAHWKKLCDDEEKKCFRVRDPFTTLFSFPVIPNSRDFETSFRDIANFTAPQGSFDENVPLADSKSARSKDSEISPGKDNDVQMSIKSEPIVKISPPTPLKKQTHAVSNVVEAQKEEQSVLVAVENTFAIKSADLREDSKFHRLSPNTSVTSHNKSRSGRIYSKETCPHHRHETAIKIFDDNIEKYLRNDPRTALPERKDAHQLPQLRDAFKYDQVGSEVTSAKRIKRVTIPRRREHHLDDVIDLIANKTTKVESKDKRNDTAERERRNVRSDVPTSDLELFVGKKSTNLARDAKMKSALPELVQPSNKAKSESGKLITTSPKSQKLSLHAFEIRDERVDNSG